MSNFKPVKNFWFWCQKVLPLVYDDSISYYEVLCKISEYLNQVIDNVNALPDIIDEAVKEYIESGEIQKVLNEMLQNFNPINVKNPPAELTPAKGDGETDDTAALQAMIEYGAEYNLPMIFPAGVYRVTSLNVPETAYFWGVGNPTIFKAPNSENALITVTGDFTAFNMDFNGNIAGNIVPANIITGTAENISLSQCNFTGCVSCVDAFISVIMQIVNCKFSNYTDYAVHAEGTGRLFVDGMEVESVANSGAIRFIRIDTNNSIVENLTSLVSVPVGVEITGNNNNVAATIPNCENPISDSGENNNFNIAGKVAKLSTENYTENVSEESVENVGTKKQINATDLVLNPENALTYPKHVQAANDYFNFVPFKNADAHYKVMVFNENAPWVDVTMLGAKGDGITDNTAIIKSAIENGLCLYFPTGIYKVTEKLTFTNSMSIKGDGVQNSFIWWPESSTSAGVEVTLNKVNNYLAYCANIENISLCCNMAPSSQQTGIKIIGTAILESRTVQTCYINNVAVGLLDGGFGNSGWYIGIELLDTVNAIISNTSIMGSINGNEPAYSSINGIYFHGSGTEPHSGGLTVTNTYASYFQTAMHIESIEGIICDKIQFVGVNTGVLLAGPEEYPHFAIFNSHINASQICINAQHGKQIFVVGCLLYLQQSLNPGTIMQFGENTSNIIVTNNIFNSYIDQMNYGCSFAGSFAYVFNNQTLAEVGSINPAYWFTTTSHDNVCLNNIGSINNQGTNNIVANIADKIKILSADPEYPSEGDIWFNTTTLRLNVRADGYNRYVALT